MAGQSPECQSPERQFRVFEKAPVGQAPGAPPRAAARRLDLPRMEPLSLDDKLEKAVGSAGKVDMSGWQT